uniref:Uncharacterized protein C20orf85 homolog isoform X2 n=1 Tax=Geotrypetes seraphini TaxID=260995 RepID=A0A6P8NPP7_GEOSA|nr:uncharacterized protein C20orf85 homolog isoform X2 [Geotrypetes seraphini]XP_033771016.1 uncharacterized protein C20orf85 homolog isoform X2 [Geotrypetes seraphini]
MAKEVKKEVKKEVNYLAQERMWKDHVENETEAAKKWLYNWGFLTTPFEELIKNEKKKEIVKIILPEHLQVRPVTPLETYIKKTTLNTLFSRHGSLY